MEKRQGYKQVVCPRCGYRMPIFYSAKANCSGVTVPCKGRSCSAIFEIKIRNGEQIK